MIRECLLNSQMINQYEDSKLLHEDQVHSDQDYADSETDEKPTELGVGTELEGTDDSKMIDEEESKIMHVEEENKIIKLDEMTSFLFDSDIIDEHNVTSDAIYDFYTKHLFPAIMASL